MQPLIPVMMPAPGERVQRFVGDAMRFELKDRDGRMAKGWRGLLRTNLGRGELLREEIVRAHTAGMPLGGESWRDLSMKEEGGGWSLELPLAEPGYFKAKAYLADARGWQHWPTGPDVGISVHPDGYRTGNTIYCAFARMFEGTGAGAVEAWGGSKGKKTPLSFGRGEGEDHREREKLLVGLEEEGYAVIPPSGTLRDLTAQLPHIFETLGCRILHLLPVNPVPTTMARFGRFGSPYAALDLTAIDPALVVFDKRTTGIDQFCELTYGAHLRGGRVFLDIVINHTGWGSVLQEKHPEWFVKGEDGAFISPGVWGVVWQDLVELKHEFVALWDELAEMFLTWCERGVDGFRCDAGYKVPLAAWQYIVARVQQKYPDTIFLLEGLGGSWEATEALLAEGGMQWAYSELFQNYSGREVASYLDHSIKQSGRWGLLVHYSETHDNERLAIRGRAWSLMRNRLCALASVSGGFGFTCGVEWLATEKIQVHGNTGMAWSNHENMNAELGELNRLLAEHPCFFDGAKLTRLSPADSPVYALRRESEEGKDVVLVLVNTDAEKAQALTLDGALVEVQFPAADLAGWVDLLKQVKPEIKGDGNSGWSFRLEAGAAYCLTPTAAPSGLHGDEYRERRMQAAWAVKCLGALLPTKAIPVYPWRELATLVQENPEGFLGAVSYLASEWMKTGLPETFSEKFHSLTALEEASRANRFRPVICWSVPDGKRITPMPPEHWLLIEDTVPFRARLEFEGKVVANVEAIPGRGKYISCFGPWESAGDADLFLERYTEKDQHIRAGIRFLGVGPNTNFKDRRNTDLVLLTNGRGGMARLCVDLGRVNSKYDCVLAANLHAAVPVDRHVFAKRIRAWVNADGFVSPLNFTSLSNFDVGPPAVWNFVANAGDGRVVEIEMCAEMVEGRNTTLFQFGRASSDEASGKELPADADVRLIVRVDIEDRNFHWETRRNSGAEHHFSAHCNSIAARRPESQGQIAGFAFTPAAERKLRVFVNSGAFHPEPEWCENIPHPVEQSRGQIGSGDAYSPGWFELPLPKGAEVRLVVTAEPGEAEEMGWKKMKARESVPRLKGTLPTNYEFGKQLLRAVRAFVVQRDKGKTIIAGYPWFLDWGRDSLIAARGMLAAGMVAEVKELALTFARLEKDGTLPNTIHGEDASNRDTSDAPLWFGIVCEELAEELGNGFYQTKLNREGRTIGDTLEEIARNYVKGTPNHIRMDPASGLIWSPSHFTWMDTNHPACTPREGYPIEIQVLWIWLLRQLERMAGRAERKEWNELAEQAMGSLEKYFWRDEHGYYADVLLGPQGRPAAEAVIDDGLRSNCLVGASLGLFSGERARRCVEAARRHLIVPGALRSLAPLPAGVPLPILGKDGKLLNDPAAPYWGRYEGDEDTRRKPAYHNGTAWTWTLPIFCEAMARAWEFSPEAVAAAKAYLGSMDRLLAEGCIGQLPEIVDGDAPHQQRGCDAQAWGATEALRVWIFLGEVSEKKKPEAFASGHENA